MDNKKLKDSFNSSERAGFQSQIINGSSPKQELSQVTGNPRFSNKIAELRVEEELVDLPEDFLKIDDADTKSTRTKKYKKSKKSKNRLFRWILRIIVIVFILALAYVLAYAYKITTTSSRVFEGSWTGFLAPPKPLKTDANGRTNLLIFGTAEDDGDKHGGPNLTDSIMIVSFKKDDDDMAMINLPRDLWVKLERPCVVGYQQKLNTVYFCGSDDGKNEKAGAEALMRKVTEITGLDLHYYTHINFGGVIALVNAVDGVDVDVQGYGPVPYGVKPGSILDRNFDWKCAYKCYYVKYEPGLHHMDGEHALAFIRARNANGGYGLPNANYDREKNQQKVINSLIKKMLKVGTITDINKFNKIFDALGDNLRTNVATDEIRSIIALAKKLNNQTARSISLVKDGQRVVANGSSPNGLSVVRPIAGLFDYSAIKKYLNKELNDAGLSEEAAKIAVLNAGQEVGAAARLAAKLKEAGLEVIEVGNAPKSCLGQSLTLFSFSQTKPRTLAKLRKVSGAVKANCEADFSYNKTLDFIIVIGDK